MVPAAPRASLPLSRSAIADGPSPPVNELLASIGLVDHHVHSVVSGPVDDAAFLAMVSESNRQSAADAAGMDTQVGIAIRRWCGPLLGLPASAPAADYLERRRGLSNEAVAAALLPDAGFERLVVDTGYRGEELVSVETLGQLAGAATGRIVRLEALAERVATSGVPAGGFREAFREALDRELATAVGLKSIIAYRVGLDFDPDPPTAAEVDQHAGSWFEAIQASGSARLVDPVILRFVLWTGAWTGRPLQVHAGYGDPDLNLLRADPLRMTDFLRATEDVCPVLLLHNYPYHRNAGYLAQMFAHVYFDVGLAINYAGAQSGQLIAESLEIAPLTKILFSSDAWGAPELHLLGSWLYRRGMARVIGGWVASGDWSLEDAERTIKLISGDNARRVYALD